MQKDNLENLLTYVKAAEFLDITVPTLRVWVAAKRIECIRRGYKFVRFEPAALRDFVKNHTVSAENAA